MKIQISLILVLFAFSSAYSQTPTAFKYQAIARDAEGLTLSQQNLGFEISILEGDVMGSVIYTEIHIVTSNENGLVNLEIGSGAVTEGGFSEINWGSNSHFLQVSMDADGGDSYQLMGTSQLLSVPYSLVSNQTLNVPEDIYINSVTSETSTTTNLEANSVNSNTSTINEVLHLTPLEASPSNPTMGDVYYDAIDNAIKHFDGDNWVEVKNTNNSGPTFIPIEELVSIYQQGSDNWVSVSVGQYVPENAKAAILNIIGPNNTVAHGLRANADGPTILPPSIGQVIVPLSDNNTFEYNIYDYNGSYVIKIVGYY